MLFLVYNDSDLMTIKDDLNDTSEPGSNMANMVDQEVLPDGYNLLFNSTDELISVTNTIVRY